MNTKARFACVAIATLLSAVCMGQGRLQPQATPKSALPAATPVAQAGPQQHTHESDDCWSAALRRGQAERRVMRDQIGWDTLDSTVQESLWDAFVGPDQINDGTGHALLRPSECQGGPYEPRDGGYGQRDLLVNFSWNYTQALGVGARKLAFDFNLNVDGDVVISGGRQQGNSISIMELSGSADATQGAIFNWSREFTWAGATQPMFYANAADLLGNTFASGTEGTGNYVIHWFNGANGLTDGGGIHRFSASSLTTGTNLNDMTLDAEGKVYVCGNSLDDSGAVRWFVARHESTTPFARNWITYIPGTGQPFAGIRINRYGEVFVAGGLAAAGSTNTDFAVVKLSAIDGAVEWTMTDSSSAVGDSAKAMDLDFSGNPYVTGQSGTGPKTLKIDRMTGQVVWRATYPTGNTLDLKVGQNGNVFVTGFESNTAHIRTIMYNPSGVQQWSRGYGTTGSVECRVALDWLDNPYVVGTYTSNSDNTYHLDVRKLDPADGSDVWTQTLIPNYDNNENTDFIHIAKIIVDAGGSVYVAGNRYGTRSSTAGGEMFIARWEQPFVSIPQIAKANPNVKLEGHSVWFPELEDVSQSGFNQTFDLFSFNLADVVSESFFDDLLSADIDYLLGTAHGEIDLDYLSNPSLGVKFVTSASGGSYDATATGALSIAVPGEGELFGGQSFPISIEFKPDPVGMEMIANSTPNLSAALKSSTTGNLDLHIRASNHFFTDPDGQWNPIFDWDVPTPSLSSLNNITLFNALPANLPPPGTWYNFEIFGVSGRATMPELKAEGVFSATATSGNNVNNPNDDDKMRLASALSETFCDVSVSVTDLITEAATGVPLSFGWALPAGDDSTDASLSVGLIQAHLDGAMKMEQALTLDMKPYLRLEFPGTSLSPVTIDLVKRSGNAADGYTYVPEASSVNIGPLPTSTAAMEIKPFFGVRSTMKNVSGLRFGASAGFDTFSIGAQLSVLDVDIFSADYCFGCVTQPIFSTPFTVFDNSSFLSEFTWNEVELASIQVTGDANVEPQLIGASRASAPMIIYDQHAPSQANLTAIASGTEPMVIYGRKFFSNAGNLAFIRHQGRTEQLTTTRLNDQSLLIQVPRRFYLLPGIARLWVTNNNGRSKTVDLPIEYPFPNFKGIRGLDGQNDPEIWAGDPRYTSAPVIAIDGGTPAGNDSFIARRDYYRVLRTSLWSSGLFTPNDPNRNLSAQAYFPSFKGWELNGNPKAPPGFPSLVITDVDAVPPVSVTLGRDRSHTDDGDFASKMQPSVYAAPHHASMQIVNPGPGGGPSRNVALDIPAPRPVVFSVDPPAITPASVASGSTLRMVVYGPDSVPYMAGYEAVKAGNFTPDSVVLFDGVVVATTFTNCGQLVAEVPSTLLTTVGAHLVTVSTPSGGTTYTEQLRTGAGVLQNARQVNSGGVSIPITFDIFWPTPEITAFSLASINVGQVPYFPTAVNGQTPPDSHNFGISGNNFAPECTVYWNGRVIPSTRSTEHSLRVTVSAQDIAQLGAARVTVQNPSPNRRTSRPASVQIVP